MDEKLEERLDNHTEPVPEGLWAELEQELSRPRVIPFYRRYAAVAAVAVLVVLSTLSLWWMRSSSVEDVDRISREIASLTPVNDGLPAPASVNVPSRWWRRQRRLPPVLPDVRCRC